MKNTLVDAGPLIALFDKSDRFHSDTIVFLRSFRGSLLTTWPVVTETSHMLSFSTRTQINFLEWIHRGGLQIVVLDHTHIARLIELSKKFDDVPMDLADASLIVASEEHNIEEIVSIDSDFYIYRNVRNQYLLNIFPHQK